MEVCTCDIDDRPSSNGPITWAERPYDNRYLKLEKAIIALAELLAVDRELHGGGASWVRWCGQAAPWFVAGASPYGGDMSLSCLCKTWIVRCHAAMSVCLVWSSCVGFPRAQS